MSIVIGIDVGGSTTKIVGVKRNGELRLISPLFITANDPVASLFGAFGKYLYDNNITLSEVDKVMITGVGSKQVDGDIYGLKTCRVDEFVADALGAHHGSNLERLIVVSMGTGTSMVKYESGKISHIGGVSIGGGTITGLSSLILHTNDIHKICEIAENGSSNNVNLLIGDICKTHLEGLPKYATASLFGKIKHEAVEKEDLAAGILHLVIETIGSCAVLAGLNTDVKDYMFIGNIAKLPGARPIFDTMEKLYGVRFHIPPYAEFRTALGAAISGLDK
ncbi:MAG: type II pantothenate kinase [Muribaculaceae bacterium]|nr:type II pantothenate kinase [Muribaculaceae bacterium]